MSPVGNTVVSCLSSSNDVFVDSSNDQVGFTEEFSDFGVELTVYFSAEGDGSACVAFTSSCVEPEIIKIYRSLYFCVCAK